MQGFLTLNKPMGITSHDAVAQVRKILRMKRVGHGGTLDPAATGVLPIALGKVTRLLQFLRSDKAYHGTFRLGVTTTTDDLAGEILNQQSGAEVNLETVTAALAKYVGKIQQVPPNYSAIQVKGKRLYELARAGKTIDIPARTVEIFKIEVLDWRPGDFPELDVAIACGSGTYIRAIARDLGHDLQIGGTLAALTRTESSGFKLSDSLTLTELENLSHEGKFIPIPPSTALAHLPVITLSSTDADRWCQGQGIMGKNESLNLSNLFQVYQEGEQFLGIGELVTRDLETVLIPKIVLAARM